MTPGKINLISQSAMAGKRGVNIAIVSQSRLTVPAHDRSRRIILREFVDHRFNHPNQLISEIAKSVGISTSTVNLANGHSHVWPLTWLHTQTLPHNLLDGITDNKVLCRPICSTALAHPGVGSPYRRLPLRSTRALIRESPVPA